MSEEQGSQEKIQAKSPDTEKQKFTIQRIYIKDISYEAPGTPDVFQNEWKPEMKLDINTASAVVSDDTHEVVLTLTATVKSDSKTAFLAEIKQAGLFELKGFTKEELHRVLGSYCPNVLYPYARERVTDLVTSGGFPQLILAPVNFDALYTQHLAQQAKQGEGAPKSSEEVH